MLEVDACNPKKGRNSNLAFGLIDETVPKSQASLKNSLKICHTSSIEIWTTFSTAGRPSAFAIIRGSQASR